jgi:hypothetical protein
VNIPLAIAIGAVCFFALGGTMAWYVVAHPRPPLYGAVLFSLFVAAPSIVAGAAVVFNYCHIDVKREATPNADT